jgi:hypothetical protein
MLSEMFTSANIGGGRGTKEIYFETSDPTLVSSMGLQLGIKDPKQTSNHSAIV